MTQLLLFLLFEVDTYVCHKINTLAAKYYYPNAQCSNN